MSIVQVPVRRDQNALFKYGKGLILLDLEVFFCWKVQLVMDINGYNRLSHSKKYSKLFFEMKKNVVRVAQWGYVYMIVSFRHKGLERFFYTGCARGIQQKHKKRLRIMLGVLDTAFHIDDIDLPGFRLHQLSGKRKDLWAITVNGNWRLTFIYENEKVFILNYEDYH